jgi:hypothetical protein
VARKFFLVAAGMFLIALSFHLGFTTATAQAPGNPVVAALHATAVVTANGDVYYSTNGSVGPWIFGSNVFGGGATQTQRATFGQVKARYAPSTGTPTSETNDR